jgi:hypothetical protein
MLADKSDLVPNVHPLNFKLDRRTLCSSNPLFSFAAVVLSRRNTINCYQSIASLQIGSGGRTALVNLIDNNFFPSGH